MSTVIHLPPASRQCDPKKDLAALERIAAAIGYTCPRCGRVSYNPNDVANRYCGACHQFEDVIRSQTNIPGSPAAPRGQQ